MTCVIACDLAARSKFKAWKDIMHNAKVKLSCAPCFIW